MNRVNYRNMAEYASTGNAISGFVIGYPGAYRDLDPDALVAEMDRILSHNPVCMDFYPLDVQEYLDEYYVNDLISAEECAKKIQDRTYMWLNE